MDITKIQLRHIINYCIKNGVIYRSLDPSKHTVISKIFMLLFNNIHFKPKTDDEYYYYGCSSCTVECKAIKKMEKRYTKSIELGNKKYGYSGLGDYYMNVLNKPKEALMNYIKAYNTGNMDAGCKIAIYYQDVVDDIVTFYIWSNRSIAHYPLHKYPEGCDLTDLSVEVLCRLGHHYYYLGDKNTSMKYLNICRDYDHPLAICQLGICYCHEGDIDKALKYITDAAILDSVSALWILANYNLFITQDINMGISLLQRAYAIGHAPSTIQLAIHNDLLGDHEKATGYYKIAADNFKDPIAGLIMSFRTENPEEILSNINKYLGSNLTMANNARGMYYGGIGELEKAKYFYKLASLKSDPIAHNNLAMHYGIENNKKEQVYHLEKASETGSILAYFNLGIYYREEGNKEKADEYFRKIIATFPKIETLKDLLDNNLEKFISSLYLFNQYPYYQHACYFLGINLSE